MRWKLPRHPAPVQAEQDTALDCGHWRQIDLWKRGKKSVLFANKQLKKTKMNKKRFKEFYLPLLTHLNLVFNSMFGLVVAPLASRCTGLSRHRGAALSRRSLPFTFIFLFNFNLRFENKNYLFELFV